MGLELNKAISYSKTKEHDTGVWFEEGQVAPTFATPADNLDFIAEDDLACGDEKVTFAALEGLVNKVKPRIFMPESRDDAWANQKENNLTFGKKYETADRFALVEKYASSLKGAVLYSTKNSFHYRNLATTVAGLYDLLPVTAEVLAGLQAAGVSLEVKVDLSDLPYTKPEEIYTYLFETYWKDCSRKIFVSVCPQDHLGYIRDVGVAVGAAVVWLDTRNAAEMAVWKRFFEEPVEGKEMLTSGKSLILGWHPEERSGIGAGTMYGISTIPSDFYKAGSVLACVNHQITMPAVPKRDGLKNKTYVALYISDGDNIQYVQGTMRVRWDQVHGDNERGSIPLSWTIAPGLVDLGPGIMNYYYNTSKEADCFVTGPSGMGYAMFQDYDNPIPCEGGYKPVIFTDDLNLTDSYTKLTERYLTKSGMRVATIWDDITYDQTAVYAKNCHSLYGTTAHAFKPHLADIVSKTAGNFRLQRLERGYTGNIDEVMWLIGEVASQDGIHFLSYQLDVWNAGGIPNIIAKAQATADANPNVEFVRADHFFNLFQEANDLSYNLGLLKSTKVTTCCGCPDALTDGKINEVWEANCNAVVTFAFESEKQITRYIVRNAGLADMDSAYNTKDFVVEGSVDGETWFTLDTISGNTEDVVDVDVNCQDKVNFARVRVTNPGCDGVTRLTQVEFFGK